MLAGNASALASSDPPILSRIDRGAERQAALMSASMVGRCSIFGWSISMVNDDNLDGAYLLF
jgi:hypothetical protein